MEIHGNSLQIYRSGIIQNKNNNSKLWVAESWTLFVWTGTLLNFRVFTQSQFNLYDFDRFLNKTFTWLLIFNLFLNNSSQSHNSFWYKVKSKACFYLFIYFSRLCGACGFCSNPHQNAERAHWSFYWFNSYFSSK